MSDLSGTILVTGGMGFIGSNFVWYLLWEHPAARNVNLDKVTYAGNPRNLANVAEDARYPFVRADVCDADAVAEALSAHTVDQIVHFAAETHVDRSILEAGDFIRTNVEGTRVLLWGGVGRGKSLMMDAFYKVSRHRRKRRVHFHEFMREIHARMRALSGTEDPLEEISAVMRRFPDVAFMVDTVSSLGGMPVEVDRMGIDLCLASVQKCLALPPGFSLCSVSPKILERSAHAKCKGWYFDLAMIAKKAEAGQSPGTASATHMYGMERQFEVIISEGMTARWARHRAMAERTRSGAKERFALFPDEASMLALTFIPFTDRLAALTERWLPDGRSPEAATAAALPRSAGACHAAGRARQRGA